MATYKKAAAGSSREQSTINMRVRAEQKRRISAAAELEHTKLSSFVMSAAEEKAERVIAEHSTTLVPADYFEALYASLDAPARPNRALAAAAAKRRRVVQQ